MAEIYKATVGIQFSERMFRVSSMSGLVIDGLLALRGKGIDLKSFEKISRDQSSSNISLYGEELGRYLTITPDNFNYTIDVYDSEDNFEFDLLLNEFQALWKAADTIIKFPNIRRIGFITEQRFQTGKKSNNLLIEKLTTVKFNGFPAKFNLSFEDHINVGHGGLPDPTKDDFMNIIRTYYDSSLDASHAEPDAINANLDVQRYYSPTHKGAPFDEIKRLKKEYDKAALKFNADLTGFGTIYAKAA